MKTERPYESWEAMMIPWLLALALVGFIVAWTVGA